MIKNTQRPRWGYILRAESFYNVATEEDEYSKIDGVPEHFHEMSHGESFFANSQSPFQRQPRDGLR